MLAAASIIYHAVVYAMTSNFKLAYLNPIEFPGWGKYGGCQNTQSNWLLFNLHNFYTQQAGFTSQHVSEDRVNSFTSMALAIIVAMET